MRKIPKIYENPIDNFLIDICENTSEIAYNNGITPNMITTLSNISCIITLIFLFNLKFYLAALFFLISYYFDCMDGYVARKYKQTSKFGDYYDHISDIIKLLLVLVALYYINKEKFFKVIPFIIITCILQFIHLGCQELYSEYENSDFLNNLVVICPVKDNKNINNVHHSLEMTKYFGSGTFNVVMVISIIYYSF
jgi:hypothetical protein